MDPGGTANLAVLGGNLPPSFGTARAPTEVCIPSAPKAAGRRPSHPNFYCIILAQSPSSFVRSGFCRCHDVAFW